VIVVLELMGSGESCPLHHAQNWHYQKSSCAADSSTSQELLCHSIVANGSETQAFDGCELDQNQLQIGLELLKRLDQQSVETEAASDRVCPRG
jgi:hypothetical protein